MAFDAGMVRAVSLEIDSLIKGARVEKINQPEKDEIVFVLHTESGKRILSLSSSANNPKFCLVSNTKENPATPPLFCILARKYLGGAKIAHLEQCGFERVIEIAFDAHDEMGFSCKMYLYCEIMGRYSNIIITNEDKKIVGVMKPVDFTTSAKRQVLPGMTYEAPPSQDKEDPLNETEEDFFKKISANPGMKTDKFITDSYLGISSATSREIAHLSEEYTGVNDNSVKDAFFGFVNMVNTGKFVPYMIISEEKPIEYSFFRLSQYDGMCENRKEESFSLLIEKFFTARDNTDRTKERASDLYKLIGNVKMKLQKKIVVQSKELEDCKEKDEYRRRGDLITSNMYLLKKGMESAEVTDYYSDDLDKVFIPLNPRLNPSQNAQAQYKKYAKLKKAEVVLEKEIEKAKREIGYLETIEDSLSRAVGATEVDEIRRELSTEGYASRVKKTCSKPAKLKPREYVTTNGYKLICGRNNYQNDEITFSSSKSDWWFHVKGAPGSHVVMITNNEEPPAKDFTEAASLAAFCSSLSESPLAEVDYTQIKYIKKPGGSKPGFVTYTTYWSTYVKPEEPAKKEK